MDGNRSAHASLPIHSNAPAVQPAHLSLIGIGRLKVLIPATCKLAVD